jgi:hypothetical protein
LDAGRAPLNFLEIFAADGYQSRRSKRMETLVGGVNTLITWFKIVATMDKDVRGQLAGLARWRCRNWRIVI